MCPGEVTEPTARRTWPLRKGCSGENLVPTNPGQPLPVLEFTSVSMTQHPASLEMPQQIFAKPTSYF